MTIQPILPVAILAVLLILALGCSALVVIRNQTNNKEKIFTMLRLGVIYILVFCIGLRPMTIDENYEFSTKNLDVLFVVDSTLSMWAEDYKGSKTRMSGVISDVDMIIDELAGSNFALVTFDDQAKVLSPFTQDYQYIKDLMETVSAPDVYYATGSSLSLPYQSVEALLQSSAKKENRKTIVFFISDGEVTNGQEFGSYAAFAEFIDNGAVLGYGTETGGKMRESSWGYVYDYDKNQDAISVIDETNLKQIAQDLGVEYINANNGNEKIRGQIEIIRESSKTIIDNGNGAEIYVDTYFYFTIALAVMLLIELVVIVRKGRL